MSNLLKLVNFQVRQRFKQLYVYLIKQKVEEIITNTTFYNILSSIGINY